MIDRVSSKTEQMSSKQRKLLYSKSKRLRGAVVILPFFLAVSLSFVYASWKFPPAWLQDIILFSTLLCLVIVYHCRTWIYRFQAGAPLLAFSFGGALFFPMAASLHVWEYHVIDNRFGLALAVVAWAISTYFMWRLFQPSRDELWNKLMERVRANPSRWLVISFVPLIWAGYGFSMFAFIDTQFDWASNRVFFPSVIAKTEHLRGSGFHYYVTLSPWPRDYGRSVGSEGPEIPAAIYDRLQVGKPACVIQHPGFLGARWYGVDACPAIHEAVT